jgi:hypothetical protein
VAYSGKATNLRRIFQHHAPWGAQAKEETMNTKTTAILMTAFASLIAALAQMVAAVRCGP